MNTYTRNYFFVFIFVASISLQMFGGNGEEQAAKTNADIRFTENKRQWDSNVLYRAQLDGGAMFLERNCFTYNFYDQEALQENHARAKNTKVGSHAFRMTFLNALNTTYIES